MIDFRYHVVSIVAVFLALAVGVLVGTTRLNGAVLDNLENQVSGLTDDRRNLQQDVRDLKQQVERDDDVTESLAPRIVAGLLRNTRVTIVATAQADGQVKDAVQKILEDADATIAGRIQLTDDFADPRRAADVKSFVTGGGQPPGFLLPESEEAGVLAGALLAHVLVRGPQGVAEPAAVNQVLSGFSSLQMMRIETAQVVPADQVVVISSRTLGGENAEDRLGSLTDLVGALDRAGDGAVVAGTEASAEKNGLIGAVRADTGLSSAVSTVDQANRAAGQVAAVFALVQQAAGRSGQYGVADNAQSAFPPTSSS